MNAERVLEIALTEKIIVVVRNIDTRAIKPLGQALLDGGICMVEVTFAQDQPETWQDTAAAITILSEQFDGRIVAGAGTVMTMEQLAIAQAAGAQYIISPHLDTALVAETKRRGLLSCPGALTPSEVAAAHRAGADIVKLFPASTLGSAYIKALRAPISNVKLFAVGGIHENNTKEYLAAGCCGIGVGSNIVNKEMISLNEWDKITNLAKLYKKAVE